MDIILGDLRKAVISYLEHQVSISISNPVKDAAGSEFRFTVTVKNASEASGGVGLTNVRYQVQIAQTLGPPAIPPIPRIRVPSGGSSLGPHGEALSVGTLVEFFNFNPSDFNLSYLQIDESQSLTFNGNAIHNFASGFRLIAKILADPDLNSVFPRNFPSKDGFYIVSPGF